MTKSLYHIYIVSVLKYTFHYINLLPRADICLTHLIWFNNFTLLRLTYLTLLHKLTDCSL